MYKTVHLNISLNAFPEYSMNLSLGIVECY